MAGTPTEDPTRSRCPGCGRRATLKERDGVMDTFERYEVATWQCRRCGAICEPYGSQRHMKVTGYGPIILHPDELG